MDPDDWQEAFVAMGAVLGEPLEASVVFLGDTVSAQAAALTRRLRSASRAVRAGAMAEAATAVAAELERVRLR